VPDRVASSTELISTAAGPGVSKSGSFVLVGTNFSVGANALAQIYQLNGQSLTVHTTLTAPFAGASDSLSRDVALEGNVAVIGSPFDLVNGVSTGAAYISEFNGSTWSAPIRITAPDAASNDRFGNSVSISGDTLVVGASNDHVGGVRTGSAYVFKKQGATWNFIARLNANDAADADSFGAQVAISGSTIAVSAPDDDDLGFFTGGVYVFELIGGVWTQTRKLLAEQSEAGDVMGRIGLALDGNTLVASTNQAEAYVFERIGGTWSQTAHLQSPTPNENGSYGHGISLDGDNLVIGAHKSSSPGAAYLYQRIDNQWHLADRFTSPVNSAGDRFAYDVAVDGGQIVTIADRHGTGPTRAVTNVFDIVPQTGPVTSAVVVFENLPVIPDGVHAIRARAQNAAGKQGISPISSLHINPPPLPAPVVEEIRIYDPMITQTFGSVEVRFSEPVLNVDITDLVLSGPAAAFGATVTSAEPFGQRDGSAYDIWVFRLTSLRTGDLNVTLAPDANDIETNDGRDVASVSATFEVDTSPRLTFIPQFVAPSIGSTFSLPFSFNQAVTGLDPSDIALSGAAAAGAVLSIAPDPSTVNGYRLTITGLNDGPLTLTFAPDAGDIVSSVGESMKPVSMELEVIAPPEVTMTPVRGSTLHPSNVNIEVTIDEPVSGVDIGDLALFGPAAASATVGAPISLANNTWRFPIQGLIPGTLFAVFAHDDNAPVDATGNRAFATTVSYTIDSSIPTGVMNVEANGQPITFYIKQNTATVRLDGAQPLAGIDITDLALGGPAAAGAQVGSFNWDSSAGDGYWFLNNLGQGDLLLTIAPDAGDITNLAGTSLPPISRSFRVDTVAPTIQSIVPAANGVISTSAFNLDVTFSEAVTAGHGSLALTGTAANGAAVAAPVQLSANVWRFPITVIRDGSLSINVLGGDDRILDLAGHPFNSVQLFDFTVQGVNRPPMTFQPVNPAVGEELPIGTLVAAFTVSDPDPGDTHTFQLASGFGDTDNALFTIVGNELRTNAVLDFETKSSLRARIRITDRIGASIEVSPTITVLNRVEAAPMITGVYVDGSAWSNAFRAHLTNTGAGIANGFTLDTGAAQLSVLPWTNLDRLAIRFSEHVNVQASHLSLVGINTADYSALLAAATFLFDAATLTATWELAGAIPADKLLVMLPDDVRDLAGTALDGEWTTGLSTQSGNGAAGGDFHFRFNVLPGDANRSGTVLGDDVIAVRNAQFRAAGAAGYSPYLDVNGSGVVLGDDVVLVRNRQFTTLPTGEPASPALLTATEPESVQPSVLSTSLLAAAVEAMSPRSLTRSRPASPTVRMASVASKAASLLSSPSLMRLDLPAHHASPSLNRPESPRVRIRV